MKSIKVALSLGRFAIVKHPIGTYNYKGLNSMVRGFYNIL